jgi:hypothetical protein
MNRPAVRHFTSGISVISEALTTLDRAPLANLEKPLSLYSSSYLALRALIRDRTDPSDEKQLLAAAYAVYGWMPTILKKVDNLAPLSSFVIELRGLSIFEALSIVARASRVEETSLFYTLNNSVVGTSKLLHFLMPDLFPIWDSRIAKLFGFKHGSHNKTSAYLSYMELLHGWLDSGENMPSKLSEAMQIGAPSNDPLSDLRVIEYALFQASVLKFGDKTTDSE